MPIITSKLKLAVERFREQVACAKDPSETISTNKAVAKLVEDQYSEAKVGNFNLIQDEPESVNGGNEARPRQDISLRQSEPVKMSCSQETRRFTISP